MQELIVILVVAALVAIVWYVRQTASKDAAVGDRARSHAVGSDRFSGESGPTDVPAGTSEPKGRGKGDASENAGPGLIQDAVATAAGLPYRQAADDLAEVTTELAKARVEAERAASRLEQRAEQAKTAIEAAAAHGGAVPGGGTDVCPPGYPIKGMFATMTYHIDSETAYGGAVPDVCFRSEAAAAAAGFSSLRAESESGPGLVGGHDLDRSAIDGDSKPR